MELNQAVEGLETCLYTAYLDCNDEQLFCWVDAVRDGAEVSGTCDHVEAMWGFDQCEEMEERYECGVDDDDMEECNIVIFTDCEETVCMIEATKDGESIYDACEVIAAKWDLPANAFWIDEDSIEIEF